AERSAWARSILRSSETIGSALEKLRIAKVALPSDSRTSAIQKAGFFDMLCSLLGRADRAVVIGAAAERAFWKSFSVHFGRGTLARALREPPVERIGGHQASPAALCPKPGLYLYRFEALGRS